MKKFFYTMLCCAAVLVFGACNEDEETEVLTFKVPMSEYDAPMGGGIKVIGFSTAADWSAIIDYTVPTAEADEWLSISPQSGKAGHHYLTLDLLQNDGYDDRTATITITSGGETKVLTVSQTTLPVQEFDSTVYQAPAEGGLVEIKFATNRKYSVTIDSLYASWLSEVTDKASTLENYSVFIKVEPTPMLVSRSGFVSITELDEEGNPAELSQMVEIVQAGGDDVGYYIIEGTGSGCTVPSVVMDANGNLNAFYLYTTGRENRDVQTFQSSGSHSPHDLSAGAVAQHLVMTTAWTDLKLVADGAGAASCTWSNDIPTENGYGGVVDVKLYMWDTDYSTTVSKDPVYTNSVEYNDNQAELKLIGSSKFAAGDYLVVLSSTKEHSGIWAVPSGNVSGYDNYLNGGKTTSVVGKWQFSYIGSTRGGITGAAYKTSKDGGKTWNDQRTIFTLNDDWVSNYSPSDLVVTKGSKYYYATFDKTANQNIYLARSESPEGPWKMWNGSDQVWKSYNSTPVWENTAEVSLVEHNGTIRVYYLQGYDLMTQTADAANDLWPSDMFKAVKCYTFDETLGSALTIDAKYHADRDEVVITYIQNNEMYSISASDGVSFSASKPKCEIQYMYPNAARPRYVVSADGTVKGDNQLVTYSQSKGMYLKVME